MTTSWLAPVVALVLLAVLAHDSAGEQATVGRSGPTAPAEVAETLLAQKLPRVEYLGGPFLRSPRVTTITVTGDDPDLVARLERFGEVDTRTGWWRTVVDGYCAIPGDCIGDGQRGTSTRLEVSLPDEVSDVDVAELLARQAQRGRFGPLDADSLLLLYLPERVTLTDAGAGRYCGGGPRGLHGALRTDGGPAAYAVVPRCGGEAQLTATASHEILEATTNPDPARRGFAFQGGSADGGFTAAGVEPVDPCGLITLDTHRTTIEGGFTVQRAWSNRAAALGHNPCVPAPDRPYVALVPREPAIRLPDVGETTTITVDATADRPTGPWQVSVMDLAAHHGHEPCTQATLNRATAHAGAVARLTVTLQRKQPGDLCFIGLVSTLDRRRDLWPLTVVTR